MRDAWRFAAVAIAIALALAPVGRARAGAGPFDGMWIVGVDCPNAGDAEGYNWRFASEVSSGFVSGLYRSATNSAMGHITGRIRPDGEALLSMFYRTGPGQRAVGHERPGTPFRYTVEAHFDARGGSGKRNEQRTCALTFNRA
jgi:hypothetical protein